MHKDEHHLGIFTRDVQSEGLKVTFDWKARTVHVTKGYFQLVAGTKWVEMASIGHRWEVPVDVTLPLPDDDDPLIRCPYLCLCFNTKTKKSGIYISHFGEFPPHIKTVEFLTIFDQKTREWGVRHLYAQDGILHFGREENATYGIDALHEAALQESY